jgi:ABC transporter substrate binding protein
VTIAVKRATTEVPLVFTIGSDPVATGLVESFARLGGRLTGVHQSGNLTGKRLEILKAILPSLHRVVTFYDPSNPATLERFEDVIITSSAAERPFAKTRTGKSLSSALNMSQREICEQFGSPFVAAEPDSKARVAFHTLHLFPLPE